MNYLINLLLGFKKLDEEFYYYNNERPYLGLISYERTRCQYLLITNFG